jgi:hypothetical protein
VLARRCGEQNMTQRLKGGLDRRHKAVGHGLRRSFGQIRPNLNKISFSDLGEPGVLTGG